MCTPPGWRTVDTQVAARTHRTQLAGVTVDGPPDDGERSSGTLPGVRRHVVVLALTLTLVLAACGDDERDADPTTIGPPPPGAAGGAPAIARCDEVEAPSPREDGRGSAPNDDLDSDLTWTLTFETSCGSFVVTLNLESAPETAASLVALAEGGFFDDTVFHRIVPGFVIQGGDPTQTGSGGPGYSTVDEPAADAAYVRGVVAMAKTAQEPAGTSGSQFFVVTGADARLPPDYAIVGEVTDGLDVVDLIGTLGDPATEEPLQAVLVESVTAEST